VNQSLSETSFPEPSSARAWEIPQLKGWKDGRVHISLKLECSDNRCTYFARPMSVSSSCRAYRKYGADRFLTVSFTDNALFKNAKPLAEFLKRPISACGRNYRLFYIKKTTAHYFATDGAGLEEVALSVLMEWLVALRRNCTMSTPKLFSRIGLSLSSTTQTLVFQPEQIRLVPDIVSPIGECMTDGCARASPAVFRSLWQDGLLATKETPTAVQARLGGAKGIWYVDPRVDPRSEEMWIEIRRGSQLKFKHDIIAFQDQALRTLVCSCVS